MSTSCFLTLALHPANRNGAGGNGGLGGRLGYPFERRSAQRGVRARDDVGETRCPVSGHRRVNPNVEKRRVMQPQNIYKVFSAWRLQTGPIEAVLCTFCS